MQTREKNTTLFSSSVSIIMLSTSSMYSNSTPSKVHSHDPYMSVFFNKQCSLSLTDPSIPSLFSSYLLSSLVTKSPSSKEKYSGQMSLVEMICSYISTCLPALPILTM